jgi:hypothetical protein
MRKIAPIVVLSMLVAGWSACRKKSNTTPDPVISRGMSAKINGIPWVASSVSYSSFTGVGSNYIEFYGYDSTGKTVELRLNNFRSRGTFHIPQPNDSAFYSIDYGFMANPLIAASGIVSIQSLTDTSVGGTFSFMSDTIAVSEGSFNVNYN